MAQTDDCAAGCPFMDTMDLLSRRYALCILWALQKKRPRRFNDIKRALHVNPVTLSQRLGDLEREGIVRRQAFDETPPRVEYSLSAKGNDLVPLVQQLCAWAERHEEPAAPQGS